MDKAALRKTTIETLALLVERYPNLRIGTIIHGVSVDYYHATDEEIARAVNQLFVTYTQLEAAGIQK